MKALSIYLLLFDNALFGYKSAYQIGCLSLDLKIGSEAK